MNLKSFFALLKNPKLAEEGRIHINIDYDYSCQELADLRADKLERSSDLKESA